MDGTVATENVLKSPRKWFKNQSGNTSEILSVILKTVVN